MYSNFINHYYLSNVHHAAALAQTRQRLTNVFFDKKGRADSSDESAIESATLEELDRVWLRQLSTSENYASEVREII